MFLVVCLTPVADPRTCELSETFLVNIWRRFPTRSRCLSFPVPVCETSFSCFEMAVRALPKTCLSTEWHDDCVLDVALHYFGCLKASEHEAYFASLPQKSKRRIVEEKLRVRRFRSHYEARPKTETGGVLKKFKSSLSHWRRLNLRQEPEPERPELLEALPEDSVDYDIKASIIYFKYSQPFDVPGVDNTFPNQKISVKDLLCDEEEINPLMQPCDDDTIRYFHLPANNMIWVEVRVDFPSALASC